MSKNFKIRVVVGVIMLIIALITLPIYDAIIFRILFGLFAVVAMIELFSFFKKRFTFITVLLATIELLFLVCSIIYVVKTDLSYFWYVVLGVPGYDVFAYFFGTLIGGKIFKKSRPFPRISKNKTWEGTILGLITSTVLVAILMNVREAFSTDWYYLLCGPFALIGDLFESFLKRRFGIKDSNEIVIKNKVFKKLELVVGGSEGHGGFLDRIDSTAFSTTVLLIISFMV